MTTKRDCGKLAAWMYSEDMTDRALAERLNMDPSYIWMLRTGARQISDGFCWRFGREFGFDLAVKLLDRQSDLQRA